MITGRTQFPGGARRKPHCVDSALLRAVEFSHRHPFVVAFGENDLQLMAPVFRRVDKFHRLGGSCLVVRAESGHIHREKKTGSGWSEGHNRNIFRNPQIQLMRAVDQLLAGTLFVADPRRVPTASQRREKRSGISVIVADDVVFQIQFGMR